MSGIIIKTIDLSNVPIDGGEYDNEYELEINIEEILDDIGIEDVIDHFGEDDLLEEMGYSSDLCFKTDLDLSEEIYENSEAYGIDLQPYFKYNNDKDVYERVLSLLENDKISYQEWDKFLKKYE